jgi:septum site-determining protein MinD
MAKVLVVTSGKGGVGKTTSTAALGAALAQGGQSVVVIDFDVGLRNLDLVLGAERRVVYDLINVVQGEAKLSQALIRDKRVETLSLLAASQTRDKDALTEDGVGRIIAELREKFDWVICDSPAGIERGAALAMRFADVAVVVTNPEVSSVRDSDRIIGLLDSKTERAERGERMEKHLLITRFDPAREMRGEMLKTEDVLEILSIPLLGIIPRARRSARLECRLARHAQRAPQRAGPRLSGCREAPQRRGRRHDGSDGAAGRPPLEDLPESCMNVLSFFNAGADRPRSRATGCRCFSPMNARP